MAKVSQETIERLNAFLDTLPVEDQNKCTLCTETLTHIVKTAEAQTGAPLATVTRELASRVNDGAAHSDKVSGEALRQRTLEMSGEKHRNCSNGTNKPEPEPKECAICKSVYPGDQDHCPNGCEKKKSKKRKTATEAIQLAVMAISQLERIRSDDPDKDKAFNRVTEWISKQSPNAPVVDTKPSLPNCRGRKLSTEQRDTILFLAEKLYPGKKDGWKRACALNEVGLKCGKKKDSFWTPTEVRNNLRLARIRQDAKTER